MIEISIFIDQHQFYIAQIEVIGINVVHVYVSTIELNRKKRKGVETWKVREVMGKNSGKIFLKDLSCESKNKES